MSAQEPMDAEAVIARIDQVLVKQFELDPAKVVPSASLVDDLEFDSLDGLDLVVALEKEFGFRVDDELVLEMETVGDIHDHVRKVYAEVLARRAAFSPGPSSKS